MKSDLIVLGLAGVALLMIVKGARAGKTVSQMVKEIANPATVPGLTGYGWRYFDDGTAIDPSGAYYLNGQMVWQP